MAQRLNDVVFCWCTYRISVGRLPPVSLVIPNKVNNRLGSGGPRLACLPACLAAVSQAASLQAEDSRRVLAASEQLAALLPYTPHQHPCSTIISAATGGMGKISNVTNSVEPTSIVSRIFVGNLNTFTLSKDDVETIFRRYGKIIGISMHKGYAFIQYTNEYDARNSVAAEDQRIYAGQPLGNHVNTYT